MTDKNNTKVQSIPILHVDGTAYRTKDFPSLNRFYHYHKCNVVIFSIDGADWVEFGNNKTNPTDKAITTHKRFLHHFLSQFGCSEIVILERCYDGRHQYSYAVSDTAFYTFVQELGYVTEQHSYLLLEANRNHEAIFGDNRPPEIELKENDTGDVILTYSRIQEVEDWEFPPSSLGWTYCVREDKFYVVEK